MLVLSSGPAEAQKRRLQPRDQATMSPRRFTYEIGGSTGSYNGFSYSELTVGLNYYLTHFMIWRNALFSRFGSQIDSASGLDTSVRFQFDLDSEGGSLGTTVFAGPGYRISNEKNSGYFLEGGAVLKLGGLHIGGGLKSMVYTNPGKDVNGADMPKTDNIIFIILAGGGAF